MTKLALAFVVLSVVLVPNRGVAQEPPALAGRFVGTWVGTQSWAIADAPPGARQDQPVTLTIEIVDGKLVATMKPFLGGDDGASFIETKIVGDELQASA